METRKIGSLEVSVLGLGCNNFGRRVDEAGTRRVVDAAIDAGVTLFDTADVYGFGHSEELVQGAIKGRNVVIATKAGNDFYNAGPADDKTSTFPEPSIARLTGSRGLSRSTVRPSFADQP